MTDSDTNVTRPPKLLRSGLVVSSMTMLSRVLGLLRDVVLARVLGDGPAADAFFVAFKIPNFFRRLFSEGAFSQAFVPVLAEYRTNGSLAAVKELVNCVAGCLGSVLLLVTLLAVVGAPALTALFGAGFLISSGEDDALKFALTTDMLRITFPYLMLISLTGFAGAILNSYDRFAIPAFTPVLLNVALIVAATVAAPYFVEPAFALAWGVLSAGVVQLLFQLPFLQRIHLLPWPQWNWQHDGVKRILVLMVPALFGVSVSQVNLLLDTILATFLPTGSVTWLYFSDRLSELPLGVFAVAVGTVILPQLSRQHSGENAEHFSHTLDWALRMIVLIAIPAAVALALLAQPILITLFQYGEFTQHTVLMSSYSLQAYASGLLAFMLIKVLAPGFYARQDMKTPVKIGIIAMLCNMLMNIAFALPLHYGWQLGHVGLAAATAASAAINALLLYRGLRAKDIYRPRAGWRVFWLRVLLANMSMAAALWVGLQWLTDWVVWNWWQRSVWLGLLVGLGLMAYSVSLLLVGLRPKHLRQAY